MTPNHSIAHDGLKVFRDALIHSVVACLKDAHGSSWLTLGIKSAVGEKQYAKLQKDFQRRSGPDSIMRLEMSSEIEMLGIPELGTVIQQGTNWRQVFQDHFGVRKDTISTWFSEVIQLRNAESHLVTGDLHARDVLRGLDSAERILHHVEPLSAEQLRQQMLRLNLGSEILEELSDPGPAWLREENLFMGRESELDELRGLLEQNPVVVLEGGAGVGKTALALRYAHQATVRGEAVAWYEIHLDGSTAALLPSAQAQLDAIAQSARLVQAGKKARTLLILDSCENLLSPQNGRPADFDRIVSRWLGRPPGSQLLLVSESSAARIGEHPVLTLQGLPDEEGLTLFSELCDASGMTLGEVRSRQFCRLGGGNPLRLKILTGLLRFGYGPEKLMEWLRLGRPLDYLSRKLYEGLDNRLKELMMACSVCRLPIMPSVLGRLTTDQTVSPAALMGCYLLEQEPKRRRVFMHPIVQEHAYRTLGDDPKQLKGFHQIIGDYYLSQIGDTLSQLEFATLRFLREAHHHLGEVSRLVDRSEPTRISIDDRCRAMANQLDLEGRHSLAGRLYRLGKIFAPLRVESYPVNKTQAPRYLASLVKADELAEAHEAFERFLSVERWGNSQDIFTSYARALTEAGEYQEAAAVLKAGLMWHTVAYCPSKESSHKRNQRSWVG
jgi:hypothetical protein